MTTIKDIATFSCCLGQNIIVATSLYSWAPMLNKCCTYAAWTSMWSMTNKTVIKVHHGIMGRIWDTLSHTVDFESTHFVVTTHFHNMYAWPACTVEKNTAHLCNITTKPPRCGLVKTWSEPPWMPPYSTLNNYGYITYMLTAYIKKYAGPGPRGQSG